MYPGKNTYAQCQAVGCEDFRELGKHPAVLMRNAFQQEAFSEVFASHRSVTVSWDDGKGKKKLLCFVFWPLVLRIAAIQKNKIKKKLWEGTHPLPLDSTRVPVDPWPYLPSSSLSLPPLSWESTKPLSEGHRYGEGIVRAHLNSGHKAHTGECRTGAWGLCPRGLTFFMWNKPTWRGMHRCMEENIWLGESPPTCLHH